MKSHSTFRSVSPIPWRHFVAAACVSAAIFACSSDDTASEETVGRGGGQAGSKAQGVGGCSTGGTGGKSQATGGGLSTGGSGVGRGGNPASGGGSTTGGTAAGGTTNSAGESNGGTLGDGGKPANTFTDSRDGQIYPTVTLGSQTWLAKNLNFAVEGSSFCYDDEPENCDSYGRLYLWSVAQDVCPSGYRLASDNDWKTLETTLGMAADQLNLEGYSTERGTDQGAQLRVGGSSGFNAPLAGFRSGTTYEALGDRTYLWTATTRTTEVWRRRIRGASSTIYRFTNPASTFAISVRCVKN